MAKRAQLADGTILEFPDETSDEVMDRAVADHVAAAGSRLPGPLARSALAVASLRRNAQGLSDNKLVAGAQLVGGAFDVVGGGVDDLAHRVDRVTRGIVGAINPNDTYEAAAKRAAPPARDPAPVTTGGRVVGDALSALMGGTQIPDVLNATGGGIERAFGKNVREATGTIAELATIPLSRVGQAQRMAPAGEALARVERNGFLTSTHAPTGPTGGVAGTTIERAAGAVAGVDKVDAMKSVANQEVISRYAARGGRLGTEFVEPTAVKEAIRRAEIPYEELRQSGVAVTPDRALLQESAAIINEAGQISPTAVRAVRDLTQGLSPDAVIDSVRRLRQQGFKRVAGDNVEAQDIGDLQLRAADALDGVLERSLQRASAAAQQAGSVAQARVLDRLYQGYIDGRAWRADLHILEEAMNPTTGAISARALARIAERRKMNPQYQSVVEAFQATPFSMQDVAPASRAAQAGTMDVAIGGGLGNALVNMTGLGKLAATIAVRRGTARVAAQRMSPWRREMNRRAERALKYGASITARGAALNSALEDEQ